jgi:PhnB protein
MKSANVYLFFGGNCEEAFNFYNDCLGGEIIMKQTYGEAKQDVPDDYKSKIIHISLKVDDIILMGSDGQPGYPPSVGENFSISINLTDPAEQDIIYNRLLEGGKVNMPLGDTFWGARFGMLKDKYGVFWMLNYEKPKE